MSRYQKAKDYASVDHMSLSIESNKIYFLPNSKKYGEKQLSIELQTSDPIIPCCTGEKCYEDEKKKIESMKATLQ